MAAVKKFSKRNAIRFGWKTTLENLTFLILITFVLGLVQLAPNILDPHLRDKELLASAFNIITYIVSLGVTLGSIKIYLKLVDGMTPQFSDLFSLFKTRLLWRYFLASLLYSLVVVLGLFLLIIPGIYIALKYLFYSYFLVDKNAGVFESFSKSGEITKGRIWNLFQFEVLLWLILLAGLLTLFLGLLVAMPTISLATAYLYRRFSPKGSK
jgi:uncharacterized membrane protein